MADDKKAPKPKAGTLESLIWLIFFLFIASAVVARLSEFFFRGASGLDLTFSFNRIAFFFSHSVGPTLSLIAFSLSTVFIFGIAWTVSKLSKLNAEIATIYQPLSSSGGGQEEKNLRWERVLEHLNSSNPSDWKLAILEADIMLDDLLTVQQRPGVTIADKLKTVELSDFTTLENAWEAHKIRNMIAHEGSNFTLTEREARRVVDLYRSVFEEFHII